jgi:predicted nucleic acid-binding protein
MREVVLDASVVFKWFSDEEEHATAEARAVAAKYLLGELQVTVPHLVFLELINVAARRRAWSTDRLMAMAGDLLAARFGISPPPLQRVAYWTGRGLTAYDACYVALAEERRTVVITADERILAVAGRLAEPLAGHSA